MSLLLALFLVVHGGVHIAYICGPAWPFALTEPWLVTGVGAAAESVRAAGIALALVTFFGFLLAALAAVGLIPARLWRPLVVTAAVASGVVLVLFITPGTLPGLAIDAVLLWAVLAKGWRPNPLFGRRARAGRPVTP